MPVARGWQRCLGRVGLSRVVVGCKEVTRVSEGEIMMLATERQGVAKNRVRKGSVARCLVLSDGVVNGEEGKSSLELSWAAKRWQ